MRVALKAAFPGIKFSVRSSTYSMGASIDMSWIDGPTVAEVEYETNRFRGADFDGMVDLKTYRPPVEIDGEMVSFGADYITGSREVTEAVYAAALNTVCKRWGLDPADFRMGHKTHHRFKVPVSAGLISGDSAFVTDTREYMSTLVHRELAGAWTRPATLRLVTESP